MLTIVQRCAKAGCEGEVRFTRRRRLLDNYLVGRCDTCGRRYKLHNGRPHAPTIRIASRRTRSSAA